MAGACLWAEIGLVVPVDAGGAAGCSRVLLALKEIRRVPNTAIQLFTARTFN